jgi:hypothetical protein
MSWVHDLDDPRRSGSSIYLNVFAFEEQGLSHDVARA